MLVTKKGSPTPNRNILGYLRNGDAGNTMDSLNYKYYANTNQLSQIRDNVTATKYTVDIDNQATNNYTYDAIGNMTSDAGENITNIKWNVYGKILNITKSGAVTRYVYDASGNRIMKQTTIDTTVYVRDASGNVMSVYTKPAAGVLSQTEMHLYGSTRLGIAITHVAPDTAVVLIGGFASGIKNIFARGEKLFELSNHLGNVLATISDRRVQVDGNLDGTVDSYKADIVSANDYYPGGMLMPGRSYSVANTNYRNGFNGKEKDKESPVQYDYGFRIYDPRLVRFKSVDPITKDYPELTPYQFASNSPISGIDLDGLEYYYTSSGALLGKYGTSTEVRVVNAEFVKKTYGIKTPISEFNKNSHSVGLTNAELNTRAFLGTITRLEDGGYHKKIGGGTFEGDEHPGGQKLRFGKKYKYVSAAGAYQITEGTYKGYKALDKTITNFSSENQDKIAVDIIDATKALGDVKAGNVNSAATKLTLQWSSLPGASEQTHSLEETKKIFKEQVSKELNNNSDISTPQGQLDLNEKKSK